MYYILWVPAKDSLEWHKSSGGPWQSSVALSRTYLGENWVLGKVGGRWVILYMSNSKTRLWLVFTLFSLFLLAEHFVQFGIMIGKLAWSLEMVISAWPLGEVGRVVVTKYIIDIIDL